jgi:acetyl-CoA carboxylase carboxyltransferase component
MGPDGAVNIVYKNAIDKAQDKDKARLAFVDDYKDQVR